MWRDSSVPPSAAGAKAEGGEGSASPRSGVGAGGSATESGRAGADGIPAETPAAGGSPPSAGTSALGGTEVGGSPAASGAAGSDGSSAAGAPEEAEACPPGCCALSAIQASDEPSLSSLLADSRQGFSDVQGRCGWTYGYLPSGAEPFTLLPHFIASPAPMWRVSTSTPPWSAIYRERQHPNQVPLQWIARRWTSPVRGALSVTGHAAKADSGGNGVNALVRVDGLTVWEERVDDSVARDFALRVDAIVGTTIDLIVAPRGGDAHDATELTAFISWEQL